MRVKHVVVGTVLAVGLGVGSLAGAGVASAAPGTPSIEKPHHGDWDDWNDWGNGNGGHGKWGGGGWYPGIDACISATGPYGNISGFVCI
jgi:hypothetical protein